MRPGRIAELRRDTVDMFYHGFDNYMRIAFPEDELRPVSCTPLTRDRINPRNVELNDVLGNYSLTLIDSLSTLAILASAPPDRQDTGPKALADFQDGVAALVVQYGDGRIGPSGRGNRGQGFDVDSKVQVFETVIRGVGGLLSAHLFAIGELPITGYDVQKVDADIEKHPIAWPNGFKYDGQLLRLALDLAQRLLPAFYTQTGMPYPRVNLRHGIPFYVNSPLHGNTSPHPDNAQAPAEITETCSAGAGSLVLEFTVLSRLTGDPRFEQAAKRAFWAVWSRRSNIGLIGAGVDAEEGHWIGGFSGIGAGIDSFFEYALKTHILLSGHELPNQTIPHHTPHESWLDPNQIYSPLSDKDNSPDSFLEAWHHAHAAIKRHLYSDMHHPHYVNAHLSTGSPQTFWIDSLGAYYSGLLTLAGELDEAIETHLLYTALWTRYSALPERWSVRDGNVEGGLGWWPGRPEFIESTYHLYRATQDPWYLYAGEMVLKDITRRCWTECGWSGLQDVRTGEKSDRMESFFLGETAKYLYLLFDADHPLNKLDASYVFTTEGHPLIIPRRGASRRLRKAPSEKSVQPYFDESFTNTCPVPPPLPPLSGSATAARTDLYNAATLIRLHQVPNFHHVVNIDSQPDQSDTNRQGPPTIANHTYFPWTLPLSTLPADGICVASKQRHTSIIEFPSNTQQSVGSAFNLMFANNNLIRMGSEGIAVNSLSGLKVGMVLEEPPIALERGWRVYSIGNFLLGRDEKIFVARDVLADISDPLFHRVRDAVLVDILLQIEAPNITPQRNSNSTEAPSPKPKPTLDLQGSDLGAANLLNSLLSQLTSALREPVATFGPDPAPKIEYKYIDIQAITPVGVGVAPLPDVPEAPNPSLKADIESLSWGRVYFADQACEGKLPDIAPKQHQVIVMRRGGCSFSDKLVNIPSFAPHRNGLQLVIVVSDDKELGDTDEEDVWGINLIRPLLDEEQRTPAGVMRHRPIPMLMVGGGEATYELLKTVRSIGMRRRYHVESQGVTISNLVVL
ncbi:putative glycoside hydrolase family 47 protein [Rosellinia necatrix]|uniref:alpha-1,2-Mannosidase n=1 Tax=Rosellinia necatrix TaxID=77044 RepID=A0A1S7ULW4_ROSNE|nr:putative glycoside hydrolase family 47 protein [Rosellinia necatrix]